MCALDVGVLELILWCKKPTIYTTGVVPSGIVGPTGDR